ncbi:MAG: endonuclease domain-containing protein [Actinomycetota bacterium]|nr:endonuclease domain-containing protein [Actinomycetota bacterium]
MSSFDQHLADRARSQLGLVTLADVRAGGGSFDHVHHRVAHGAIAPRAPGVYALRSWPETADQRLLAAILSIDGPAAVSHLAAARRYGANGYRSAPPELTVPRGTRIVRPGIRIHESTDLDRCSIRMVQGVPTTDPARTVLDLGRYVGVARLKLNAENFRRLGLLDWPDLVSTLAAHARRGRPGIRRLRAVVDAEALRRTITDSELEMLVLSLLREAGLPEPVLHHDVWDGDRFVAEVDLAYPEQRIAIECDGDVHLDAVVRQRDLRRQNDLQLLGWLMLRFTAEDYRKRSRYIVSEVRAALHARSGSETTI